MKITIILNDAPYGNERAYNALRLAGVLQTIEEDAQINVFLLGDAVFCAKKGQKTPQGYYNVEKMLLPILRRGLVLCCQTCMEARGLTQDDLVEGCRIARLGDLGNLVLESDKVLTF